jgi:tetratricopeptide (TPR) repeat protein
MKTSFGILAIFILMCNSVFAQETLFEKVRKDLTISKTANEKIERFKTRKAIKNWEEVLLKASVVLSKNFKGVFNILDKNVEFEITKDYGKDVNGVQGYKAELKEGGYAILSNSEKGMGASIWYKENFYSIESVEDGIYFVSEVDINEIAKHDCSIGDGGVKNKINKTTQNRSSNSVLSAANIKVFVAYTPAVAQNYNVSILINQCISTTNTAYQFSLVSSTIELAGSAQLTYTESGDDSTDVTRFMTKNDSYLDEIHSLRNQYDADVCVLLVNTLNSNGSVPGEEAIGAQRYNAFFVVKASAAVSYYSFPHELGHLLGCRHDSDTGTEPYYNAHGYNWHGKLPYSPTSRFYKTIMSVEEEAKYKRVQYFSNPNVYDQLNNPMGTLNYNYCAYAIDDYSSTLAGFAPYYTVSGTLTENEWWRGTVTITGNVTVPNNITLTIEAGAQIYFNQGASLIVNGTLNAVGNSTNKITFTRSGSSGTWGGIKFNSGSSGSVQYCDISYANYGVHLYISPSSIVVCNNTITNGSVGIYCHQTTSTLLRNIITGQSSYGLSSFDSDVYLTYNGQGNNVIRNNNYGVQSGYESVTYLSNGSNCVHNNTNYEVYAIMYSVVNAENTWWNYTTYPYFTPSDFWIQYYSTVDADPNNLRSDPNNCPLMKSTNLPSNGIITGGLPIDKEIIEILEKEKEGRYEEAIRKYKEKLKENIAIGEKGFILSRLAKCYIKTNRKDFTEYLNTEIRSHIKSENELYGYSINAENLIMLAEKKYEKAVDNYTIIRNNYSSNEQLYKWSTYNLGMLNSYQLNKAEKGKEYFRELIEKYPEDELSVHSRIQIGEMDGYVNGTPEGKEIVTEVKQTEYTIDNYPNPFNPTTTIQFALPEAGKFNLKIYNILGQEVVTLIDKEMNAGIHKVNFDASKLASGIYVYRLVGNNVNLSKKMILAK